MRLRVVWLVVLGVVLAAFVTACGGSDDSTGAADTTEAAGTTETGGGDETYSVGIVDFAASEPSTVAILDSLEASAEAAGNEVTRINPEGSADKAVAAIQTLTQKDVDLIYTAVFPSTELTGGVAAAQAAGIPIVSVGGGATEGVQTNYDVGKAQGGEIADLLVEETGGKGNLLVLGFKSGLPCVGREEALDEGIESASFDVTRSEVQVPGQVGSATGFTQAFLAKHPSDDEELAVWACFDEPALGAIAAIKQAGRSGIPVYGFDGIPAAIKAVQQGDLYGDIWLNKTLAGEEMAKAIPQYVEEGVDKATTEPPVPYEVVTRDNVEEFLEKFPEAAE